MPCCGVRATSRRERRCFWVEADALGLPFPEGRFDLITAAFGFRNLADYDAGLREMVRLLRPGGRVRNSGFRGSLVA